MVKFHNIAFSDSLLAMETRLREVQTVIQERIRNGHIAKMPNVEIAGTDMDFLAKQAGLVNNLYKSYKLQQWGSEAVYYAHRPLPKLNKEEPDPPRNSYLGELIFQSAVIETTEPEFS